MLVIYLLLMLPLIIWDGFVLSNLWNWFAVPILHCPHINLIQAAGLMTICLFLYPSSEGNENKDPFEKILKSVVMQLVILAFGFIIHCLM